MSGHDLLLFGGAANTGLELARHARMRGLSVACLLRPGRDAAQLEALGATVLRGDAFLPEDCARAVAEARPRAVVSVLGGKDGLGRRVDALGNIHAIDAAAAWRADLRFLLLTSLGCDEQAPLLSERARSAMGEAMAAKTLAERHLRQSGLRWTIVRPGGLSREPGRGCYALYDAPPAERAGYLPRADAALAALELLDDAHVGKVWTVLAG